MDYDTAELIARTSAANDTYGFDILAPIYVPSRTKMAARGERQKNGLRIQLGD